MTHFEAPAAKRNKPSAEKAREVKHWPEVLLLALRLSDESRPPAMSRLPSIVPCIVAQIAQQGCQLACVDLTSSEFCLLNHSKWCLPDLLMLPQMLSSCAMVCQGNQRKGESPEAQPQEDPRDIFGHPVLQKPASCHWVPMRVPGHHVCAAALLRRPSRCTRFGRWSLSITFVELNTRKD